MGRKRYTVEQIIRKLREAEVELAKGSKTPQVCRKMGIPEQTLVPLAQGVRRDAGQLDAAVLEDAFWARIRLREAPVRT